ncbi:MAG: hypothetical protein SFT92_08690 [Rickettsiales bacterium]|nr:hypothetical protein [Rickettsiales bacterium]
MDLPAGSTEWLGATPVDGGTNFVFYTGASATGVDLCLFDQATGSSETQKFSLTAKDAVTDDNGKTIGYLWHGFAKDVSEGALYGFRVSGPYNPNRRQFFNPNKLLVDPCAKAITHEIHTWEGRHFPSNNEDNATIMPKARVVDWRKLQQEALADIPVGALYPHADTNIMEMHVKGATILHPDIPKEERGTYKALGSQAFIDWVKEMGITSLELMPVESFGTDAPLADRGKRNYWGYMTLAPTAPHTGYAATNLPEKELAEAVKVLKKNGIEVIMDIVPNHTLESGREGPVVNLRGMDDTLYLPYDYTGTGNTRDFAHPINRRMLLEELRHWQNIGVSGFRIDLATIIGREKGGHFNPNSAMMKAIRQDTQDHGLRNVKLYGEPWDLGPNGYQIGRLAYAPKDPNGQFNERVAEWDGISRDILQATALSPWVNVPRGAIIQRLAGSDDLYADPQGHVVKIMSHDGPTLHDSVTYAHKHNEANGENNRDGQNSIANWGEEGETNNPVINANRQRVQRFAISLLAIAQGVPMMSLGHERGKSQLGNTNAYCQDNEITHVGWGDQVPESGHQLMEFTKQANHFRKAHPSLRRATFFTGKPDMQSELRLNDLPLKDVAWLAPNGKELKSYEMNQPGGFGILMSGDPGNSLHATNKFTRLVQRQGRDTPLLILVNPTMQDMEFTLPNVEGVSWKPTLNSLQDVSGKEEAIEGTTKIKVGYKSLIAFEATPLKQQEHPRVNITGDGTRAVV